MDLIDLPPWVQKLRGYYWMIRNEGRNKALRRRYYRYVAKEKLRLVENGIEIEQINAVCRYLASNKKASARLAKDALQSENRQMRLPF